MATSFKEHVDKDAAAAYEYLCRFEEAKKWMEAILMETLPHPIELENSLSNGVLLCTLGKKLLPNDPMWKKVYDSDQTKFKARGLDYRHTDNVNFWLATLNKLGLPKFFLPSVEDIYQKKNFPKLIYCIHALSYFLKKQNLVGFSVDDLIHGKPTFSNDDLHHTSTHLSKLDTLPSFHSLGALVEEELLYKALGLVESAQIDEVKPESGPHETLPPVPEFDDPQYAPISSALTKELLSSAAHEVSPVPLLHLPCKAAGISVSLYPRKHHKGGPNNDIDQALEKVNEALDRGDVQGAFVALENQTLSLPFVFKDPHSYFVALMEERKNGIPGNVLCVYSGLSRESCESILGVQGCGAYLIRESKMEPGTYIFSFRNQSGVKHWKIMSNGGYYLWSGTRYTFDEFIEQFLSSLCSAAKLCAFQAVSASLQVVVDVEDEKATKVLGDLRNGGRLTYGQLYSVVRTVNSDIRRSKKVPATMEDNISQPRHPWDHSKVVSMSRSEAENILNKEGAPGSFLIRTSDTSPGDYALAFRTTKEIRHWKIVCKGQKYYVHPRPNPYSSLEDIAAHFQEAVGLETKLVMIPLDLKTDKTQPVPTSEKSNVHVFERIHDRAPEERAPDRREKVPDRVPERVPEKALERVSEKVPEKSDWLPEAPSDKPRLPTYNHGIQPSLSMSKLNPANLTSWTVDDVCQWLFEQDFGQYIEVFKHNAIDGECLLTLDNELLKTDLGITALGHRSRMLKRLNELKAYGHR